ncbi:MAG TPA: DUF503 domain-containing protein [bacterium (Candidatus Stahlbacteria)]|nr:DUF503 domain-containing protein [Candidatus Stahlbacteria bacterium]
MVVGICYLEIYDRSSNSLKDKRRLLNSLKEKLKNRFNICVIEIDHHQLWQRSRLAVITGGDPSVVDRTLKKVISYVEKNRKFQVIDFSMEKR